MTEDLTNFEKLIESMVQIAAAVSEYYKQLLANGIDEKTAKEMSIALQDSIILFNNKK